MIVQVTCTEMLRHKANFEYIEPIEKRIKSVEGFVQFFKKELSIEMSTITDPFGGYTSPTRTHMKR